MYLVCPRCSSIFDVEAKSLGEGGRQVCCSVCEETWQAQVKDLKSREQIQNSISPASPYPDTAREESKPDQRESQPLAPAPVSTADQSIPPPLTTAREQQPPLALPIFRRRRKNIVGSVITFLFGWSIWGLCMFALIHSFDRYSIEIITRFPRTIPLYEALDMLPPELQALKTQWQDYSLSKARISSEFRNAKDRLVVRVLVTNLAPAPRLAPVLRGGFQSPTEEEIAFFHFIPQQNAIPANAKLLYSLSVAFPQENATRLVLSLMSPLEAQIKTRGNRLATRRNNPKPK